LIKDPTPKDLHDIYTSLLERCEAVAKRSDDKNSGLSPEKMSPFSYNLCLTNQAMVLCPRLSEGSKIKTNNGDLVGPILLNGTILGGTLLVKNEQEWDAFRNDEEKLKDILLAIGVPPATDSK
jgi:ATP adenylyltransferase